MRRCQTCGQAKKTGSFIGKHGRKCQSCRRARPPRVCCICKEEKPAKAFEPRHTTCRECSSIPYGAARNPRACLRCWEVKPPTDFDFSERPRGSHARRRRGVCKVCLDAEAAARAAREQELAKRRRTWVDPVTGRKVRRCCECEEVKDYEDDFYVMRRAPDGSIAERTYLCKPCQIARSSRRLKERREDPETGAAVRAQYAAYQRASRKRNPAAYKRAQARWKANREADPVRQAAYLENARIRYRLKREREGYEPHFHSSTVVMMPDNLPRLPSAPLGALIYALVEEQGSTLKAVCLGLDVDPRNAFAWKHGERELVQFDVADRVLTASSLTWWEVWPLSDYPEVHDLMFGEHDEQEPELALA